MTPARRWDIFCKVIDNYGDIGVCWRLARQLADEHRCKVRLWVDDLASLGRLAPGIEIDRAAQIYRNVEVRSWPAELPRIEPDDVADAVIEAFGCPLPDRYLRAMVTRASTFGAPVWINLEYLSAEPWVASHHGLPSPHPRLPLVKYFFFPGFTAGTGGLIAETGLGQRRLDFLADKSAQHTFWRSMCAEPPRPDEIRISMFAYSGAGRPEAFTELLALWAGSQTRVTLLIPEGVLRDELSAFFPDAPSVGAAPHRGALAVHVFSFLGQDDYDRLLWVCDFNFVRGEDSFVRAQWAEKPFVWQVYPQDAGAHLLKLDAFIAEYTRGWPSAETEALAPFWRHWNQASAASRENISTAWRRFGKEAEALTRHAEEWSGKLSSLGDLATNLVCFAEQKRGDGSKIRR